LDNFHGDAAATTLPKIGDAAATVPKRDVLSRG